MLTNEDRAAFDIFLEGRVAKWHEWVVESDAVCSLPTFLGMNDQEYGDWFLGQLGPNGYERLNRIWTWKTFNRSRA